MGNRTFSNILRLIVIIAVVFCTFVVTRNIFPKVEEVEVIKRDTVWRVKDSIVYIEKPVIRWKTVVEEKEIPVYLDCDSLREAFRNTWLTLHETNGYGDTIVMDTTGYFFVNYEVFRNQSQNFSYGYHIEYPEVTNTIVKHPYNVFIGAIGGRSTLAPYITLTKKNNALYGSYNVITKEVNLGYSRKIFSF